MEGNAGCSMERAVKPLGFAERLSERESRLNEEITDVRRMKVLLESNPAMKELLEIAARINMRL